MTSTVDDQQTWTAAISQHPAFQRPCYLILNFAVGSNGWAGVPDATTPTSAQMLVDWVRVWGQPGDRGYLGGTPRVEHCGAVGHIGTGHRVLTDPPGGREEIAHHRTSHTACKLGSIARALP